MKFEITATESKSPLVTALGKSSTFFGQINGVAYGSGDTEAEAIAAAAKILNDGIASIGIEATFAKIESEK